MSAERKFVVFRLNEQAYGADINVVREVNYLTPITRLPGGPEFIEGVVDLRGQVLPVADLRKRMGLASQAPSSESRLMILEFPDRTVAIIVDGVEQVLTLTAEEVQTPSSQGTEIQKGWVQGLVRSGDRLVLLLDLAGLLGAPEGRTRASDGILNSP